MKEKSQAMKVLITGATGLVGKEVVDLLLQNGVKINYLTTSKNKIQYQPNYNGFYWNPETGIIDENCLIGVRVIINLAGSSIAQKWTSKNKEDILESRILSANLLYNTLKHNPHNVTQIISASAIGIYPSHPTHLYTEDFTQFTDTFLSNVVLKWEDSINQIERLGIKVCKLRIGLVLSKYGGVLSQMVKPIKMGMGAPFGSGMQMQSWIHIKDLAEIFLFVMNQHLKGAYNAVAPNPVTNKELIKAIAETCDVPLLLPNIPKFMLKLLLGEMHTLLLDSQNVSSNKIQAEGFHFQFNSVDSALEQILKE
ncbi:TIGR01777 family oxidoreductase [Flavobacterium hankyongi]|uniref:TIGR01777 family oxidoreductase n=2 Tax=Flavobacteriaceae TaxID=49546 RepID=A0ABP9A7U9_9FLAO